MSLSWDGSVKIKAWVWNGDPEPAGLQLMDKTLAGPGEGEVLVENRAVALNPVDWKLLRGGNPAWKPGHIAGVDAAGVVVSEGANSAIPAGARVAFHHDLERDGTFATHTVVSSKALLPIPDGVSFRDAAAVPCPGLTAWQAMMKVPEAAGRDVLVVGGGSATGTFLVQLGVARGYRVWTTASPAHETKLRSWGVAGVYDYRDAEWRDKLAKALGSRKLYAAFDNVGEQHARSLVPLIGYNGHMVCIAGRLNTPAAAPFSTVISSHEVALGAIYRYGLEDDWKELQRAGDVILRGIASGSIQVPEATGFQFEALAEALGRLKSGEPHGKLVTELSIS